MENPHEERQLLLLERIIKNVHLVNDAMVEMTRSIAEVNDFNKNITIVGELWDGVRGRGRGRGRGRRPRLLISLSFSPAVADCVVYCLLPLSVCPYTVPPQRRLQSRQHGRARA